MLYVLYFLYCCIHVLKLHRLKRMRLQPQHPHLQAFQEVINWDRMEMPNWEDNTRILEDPSKEIIEKWSWVALTGRLLPISPKLLALVTRKKAAWYVLNTWLQGAGWSHVDTPHSASIVAKRFQNRMIQDVLCAEEKYNKWTLTPSFPWTLGHREWQQLSRKRI